MEAEILNSSDSVQTVVNDDDLTAAVENFLILDYKIKYKMAK